MINIPDTDHGTTSIRIEGNKEGVQKAKKVSALLDLTCVVWTEVMTLVFAN